MLTPALKKRINKLHQKKYRDELHSFLVEGPKGVEEALKFPVSVQTIVVEEKRREEKDFIRIVKNAIAKDIQVEYMAKSDIGETKTTSTFPGVLAVVTTQEYILDDIQNGKPIIALDKVQDPGNVGTIIRTAHWFGIPNLILSEGTVDMYNEKVVRSTMGSIFHSQIIESKNLANDLTSLKENGYKIIALDMHGDDVYSIDEGSKSVYIFGSESHGISLATKKIVDKYYTIPGEGAESLNVAVAAGVTLSHITK